MTVFTSKVSISKPANVIYQFLADMNNHRKLMPDNISDWTSTTNEARFNIQNMASLALKIDTLIENKQVKIVPFEKPPFNLDLTWEIAEVGSGTDVVFTINADLNMMLKMLASGPLQKLADHETANLANILNQD
jgi:carbon monoxide dehydrogenase subunit G